MTSVTSANAARQKETTSAIPCKGAQAKERLHQQVSHTAYELYEQDGRQDGRDQAHWFRAKSQVARDITDIQESASWYTFNYPLDGYRPEEVFVSVEPEAAWVVAELASPRGDLLTRSVLPQGSLYLTVRWPTAVDASTASAYIKEGLLSVSAKRAQAG
jgi:HSP20 family molecular chaperone IbpA